MSVRGVLFDLDGTLLDIDINSFIERYYAALSHALEPLSSKESHANLMVQAVKAGTEAMMRPHPGRTNRAVFHEEFTRITDVDLDEHTHVLDRLYSDVFPALGNGFGPMPGARRAVEQALGLGMKIALATNPIFPLRAIEHRVAWAELTDVTFHTITSYETSIACKPYPDYYRQVAEEIGLAPEECLMVGDDRWLDLPASAIGMRTFYVGPDLDAPADYRGPLATLVDLLPTLAASHK